MSIPKGVAGYIGVEEGTPLNDASYEHIATKLRKAIVDDATLSSCPAANDFPEGLWNAFCLALILTPTVSPGSAQRTVKAAGLREGVALQRKRQKSRESSQKNRVRGVYGMFCIVWYVCSSAHFRRRAFQAIMHPSPLTVHVLNVFFSCQG